MTKQTYIKMTGFIRSNTLLFRIITSINSICTYFIFAAYPLFLIFMAYIRHPMLADAIIIPSNGFIVISLFRHIFNRPRPYEKFGAPAVIPKEKHGHSFPSRHVFSAFIISFTILYCSAACGVLFYTGIAFAILSCLIAAARVLLGVHFISDVIAAFIFATIEIVIFL